MAVGDVREAERVGRDAEVVKQLAVAVAGGLFSLGIWRRPEEAPGRRFLGGTGALLALLASFAIVLQAISVLIIPPCAA